MIKFGPYVGCVMCEEYDVSYQEIEKLVSSLPMELKMNLIGEFDLKVVTPKHNYKVESVTYDCDYDKIVLKCEERCD